MAKYRQEAVAAGSLKRLEVYASGGSLVRLYENGYVVNQTSAPFTAHKTSEQVTDYLSGGSVTTRKEYAYDGYANLVQESDLGLVGTTADDVVTESTFRLNTTDYIVDRPVAVSVKDAAGTVLRQSQLVYDGAADNTYAPTKGHVTRARSWLASESRWLEATTSYDSYGNPIAQVDALGNRTETDYDSVFHQYPVTVRNPLWFDGDTRQVATSTINATCGQPASGTDSNGQVTSFTYDALCRLVRTDYPTGDYETASYANLGVAGAQYEERTRSPVTPGGAAIWSRSYFDGLGREYKAVRMDVDPAKPVVSETLYSKRGDIYQTSLPYFQGDSVNWTTSKVDILGRSVLTTLPDGKTISTAYEAPSGVTGAAFNVAVTDPLGRVARSVYDSRGNELRRIGYLGSTAVTTSYGYDVLGQLVSVTDPNGNAWSNSYDSLGRRLSSTDPDLGTWTYAYDDLGRVILQTDAKGQQIVMNYDRLGRVLSKIAGYGQPGAQTTSNVYDEARPGYYNVGRLTTAANDNAIVTYDYDTGGRLVRHSTLVDSSTYVSTAAYDVAGRITSRNYPDGATTASYAYDLVGRPYSLTGAISSITYRADGQVAAQTMANGTSTAYAYDPARLWLNSMVTTGPSGTLASYTYTRDFIGRITTVDGLQANEDWIYGYDGLGRLLSAANINTPALSQTFTYDAAGNILTNSAVGTYGYPAQGKSSPLPARPKSATRPCGSAPMRLSTTRRKAGASRSRR